MKPIVLISGPTAAGKTALAMALAERYPISLVNVDSAQVYRGLDIGAAKPSAEFLKRYPHALIDIRAPEDTYSVAEFVTDAQWAIDQAHQHQLMPVLVGGTSLYLRAILYGLDTLPAADAKIRTAIAEKAETVGWQALHAELITIDPSLGVTIRPSDRQRIQRALEIHQITGQPPSALMTHNRVPLYPSLRLVVTPKDRSCLHQRIALRFDQMLAEGLVAEVERLMARPNLSAASASMKSIGYRQVWEYLAEGGQDRASLRSKTIAATRQLAKRQLTALRKLSQALWYDSESSQLVDMASVEVSRFMAKHEEQKTMSSTF